MKKIILPIGLFLMAVAFPLLCSGAGGDTATPLQRATAVDNLGVRQPVLFNCKTDAECQPATPVNCKAYKCVPYKSIPSPLPGGEPTTVGKCTEEDAPCKPICEFVAYTDECATDADCNKVDKDNNPCTQSQCVDETYSNTCNGKTTTSTYKKCGPEVPVPGKDCGPETCPTCPTCLPPKIDCSLLGDPKLRDCCVAKGGLLWLVMDSCVTHGPGGSGDCTNIAEHIDNSGNFQQCCLINNGVINGDINMCNNNGNPGGGPSPTGGSATGGTTTPAGLGTCQVQCKDADCNIAVDKAGNAVGWLVTYSPSSDVGAVASVALKQLEGDALTADDPASAGGALSIKTITDPSNLPPFVVYTQKPTSMMGTYLPKFKVAVELDDVSGSALATYTCGNETALEAKGSGGCGCSMTAQMTTRDQIAAYAVMLVLFTLPQLLLRYARHAKKRE